MQRASSVWERHEIKGGNLDPSSLDLLRSRLDSTKPFITGIADPKYIRIAFSTPLTFRVVSPRPEIESH